MGVSCLFKVSKLALSVGRVLHMEDVHLYTLRMTYIIGIPGRDFERSSTPIEQKLCKRTPARDPKQQKHMFLGLRAHLGETSE